MLGVDSFNGSSNFFGSVIGQSFASNEKGTFISDSRNDN